MGSHDRVKYTKSWQPCFKLKLVLKGFQTVPSHFRMRGLALILNI